MAKSEKWPALNVERRAVADLKPNPNNPRVHTEEQVAQIVASIREWGWTQPILIEPKGGVLAGHGRLQAAQVLGLAEVPVIVAAGWTKAQKQAYLLADNQIGDNSKWDENLLAVQLGELNLAGFDIDLLGFPEFDLGGMFAPNLTPDSAAGSITAEDIAKTKDALENNFTDKSKQTIVPVACPHCGQTFSINKDAL